LSEWSGVLVVGLSYERPVRHSSSLRLIGLVNETADGFRALRRHRQAGTVTWIAVAQVFTRGCLNVFLVVIAFDLLDSGDAGVGVLTAAIGAGAVIGALAVAAIVTGRHLAALEGVGVALWGLPLVFCAAFPNEPVVLLSMCVIGIGNALVDVGLFSLPPRFVPEELLARAFGAFESLAALAVAFGSLITPAAISWFGIRGALAGLGLIAPICVVASWRHLRTIDACTVRRDEQIDVLRRVAMLRPLPMPAIENLASRVVHVEIPAGKPVVQQGEPGDSYYVIESGEAEVLGDGTVVRSMGTR
jgi:hypothetical protein